MRVIVKRWHAVAQWRWDTGNTEHDDDGEGDVCGICRVPYEGCCPSCKMPGDDCPLSAYPLTSRIYEALTFLSWPVWGQCTHVFHMHCLLKWIGTPASKQQCPMDRKPWGLYWQLSSACTFSISIIVTAERKVGTAPSWPELHHIARLYHHPCIDNNMITVFLCNHNNIIPMLCKFASANYVTNLNWLYVTDKAPL